MPAALPRWHPSISILPSIHLPRRAILEPWDGHPPGSNAPHVRASSVAHEGHARDPPTSLPRYAATSGPSNTVLRTPSYLPHPITLFLHETILFFQAHHARQTSKCPCTCTSTHLSEYSLTEMFTDLIQSGGGCSRYFAHDGCHPLYLH